MDFPRWGRNRPCQSGLGFQPDADGLVDALAGVFQQIARPRAVGVEAVIVARVVGIAVHDAADEVVRAGRLTSLKSVQSYKENPANAEASLRLWLLCFGRTSYAWLKDRVPRSNRRVFTMSPFPYRVSFFFFFFFFF